MSKVIFVTGPSGAGKSSAAQQLAEQGEGEWALINQDDIRALLKAGYRHADVEWTEETRRQWEVSILIATDMIKRYHEADINCVVDLFAPPSEFEKWKPHLKDINYQLFVLLPHVEAAVERNANRELVMKEVKIRENHEWFTQWKPEVATIIDTTNQTLNETVAYIKALV